MTGPPVDTPYADALDLYWENGWAGCVLPVPARTKKIILREYTGATGRSASYADAHAWLDDYPHGNIALRLPQHIVGIDVDDYDHKHGGDQLAAKEAELGELPPTWRSSSRGPDDVSGIRWFTVPADLVWVGQVAPDIEIVQFRHRYAVVWPSIHPEGRLYCWITPDGQITTHIPHPDDFPPLPERWVTHLSRGHLDDDPGKVPVDNTGVAAFLARARPGPPCERMTAFLGRVAFDDGAAHDALNHHVMRLMGEIERGHAGGIEALGELWTRWVDAARNHPIPSHRRSEHNVTAEWARSLPGAIGRVLADPSDAPWPDEDPCTAPARWPTAGELLQGKPATGPIYTPRIPDTFADLATDASPDGEGDEEEEHTSWWLHDLAAILDGDAPKIVPTVLRRSDGVMLFYPGRINGLLGESESGKTWVALHAVAQEVKAGNQVLYLDFEDSAKGIVERLMLLGLERDELLSRFGYINPQDMLGPPERHDLETVLASRPWSLIVADGYNAAMDLMSLHPYDNGDIMIFNRLLLKPLAQTGAAAVTIDHVPKDKEKREKGGIGAQAKRSTMTGCALRVEVLKFLARGSTGRLSLTVDKDRPGEVRAAAADADKAGVVYIDSGDKRMDVQVRPVGDTPTAAHDRALGLVDERPEPHGLAALMEEITRVLAQAGHPLSTNKLRKAVRGRDADVDRALERLVQGEWLSKTKGERNAMIYEVKHIYQAPTERNEADTDEDED